MKQQILKNYQDLSEAEKSRLIGAISDFLFNHPYNETKDQLWTFYKTWVCNGAKVADPDEHEDNILFYDNMIKFFKACSSILKMDDN